MPFSHLDTGSGPTPEIFFEEAFIKFAECFRPGGDIKPAPRRLQDMSFLEGFGMSSVASLEAMREEGGIRWSTDRAGKKVCTIALQGPLQPELARFYCESVLNIARAGGIAVADSINPRGVEAYRRPGTEEGHNAEGGRVRPRGTDRNVAIHIPAASLEALTNELNRVSSYLRHEENLVAEMTRTLEVATAFDRIEGTKLFPYLHITKEQVNPQESVYTHRFDMQCDGIPKSLVDNDTLKSYVTSQNFPSPNTKSRDLTKPYSGYDRYQWIIEHVSRAGAAEAIIKELQHGRAR